MAARARAEEVVMESTAQYWKPVAGAESMNRSARSEKEAQQTGTLHWQAQSNATTRTPRGFPMPNAFGEAARGRELT